MPRSRSNGVHSQATQAGSSHSGIEAGAVMDKDTQLVSDRQLDLIKEILNVGVGHAAASLNSLVDSHN